jgi:hypothetical protein
MRELSSAPEGHLFELLVLPGAETRSSLLNSRIPPGAKRTGGTEKLSGAAAVCRVRTSAWLAAALRLAH